MFREFSMTGVKGYNELSNLQKSMFDATYKKHLSSMSADKRINYTENNLQKIEGEISLIMVYFKNGESFIYLQDNKWVKLP